MEETNKPFALTGLTSDEVQEQIRKGLKNTLPDSAAKSTEQIFRDNICTLFNLFNVLIAVALACVGAWSNMAFILIIALNTAIGIAQELHAKKLVEELSLLSLPTACVVRDGTMQTIPVQELVEDDVVVLDAGKQVSADCVILEGEAEVNEALLTGESDPVFKSEGDYLLSGSAVISGKCRARIEHVGDENYAVRIAAEAKRLRGVHSELLTSMRKVTRFTGYLIPPLGMLLFLEAYVLRGDALNHAVVTTAAGLLGMLPKGLVLLISISLAAGIVSLSKKKVLVQELYALETLAHVDTLCLDKTGTLTQGKMQVETVVLTEVGRSMRFAEMMAAFLAASDDNNATFQALKKHFVNERVNEREKGGATSAKDFSEKDADLRGHSADAQHTKMADREAHPEQFENAPQNPWKPLRKIPFSSGRKWSAAVFEGFTVVVGAPERLLGSAPEHLHTDVPEHARSSAVAGLPDSLPNDFPNCPPDSCAIAAEHFSGSVRESLTDCAPDVDKLLKKPEYRGKRLLVAGLAQGEVSADEPLPPVQALAVIVIADPLRPNAAKTLAYFKREGVDLKLISGDNPATVSALAEQAGFPHADRYLDMTGMTDVHEIEQAALRYSIFGRVSPVQKRELVRALQKNGRSVAMTGDGVNDLLALREADCSISVGEGSDAARQVAQVVLLDSDFSSLPVVLAEGRRAVNNITRVAGVFFVKTIYSVLISGVCLLLNVPFPFLPIQITLIDAVIEGYPAFFTSFQPDGRKVEGRFLPSVMRRAVPNALSFLLCFVLIHLLAPVFALSDAQSGILCYLLVGSIGIQAVFKSSVPFDNLRLFLCTTMTAGFYTAVLLLRGILKLALPTGQTLLLFFALLAVSIAAERAASFLLDRKTEKPVRGNFAVRQTRRQRGFTSGEC